MNEFSAYTRPVPGGHWAMLRLARDSHPKPIMGKGDKPIIYPTELDATTALLNAVLAYFNGSLVRDGVKAERYSAAEALFKSASPSQRSKGHAKC